MTRTVLSRHLPKYHARSGTTVPARPAGTRDLAYRSATLSYVEPPTVLVLVLEARAARNEIPLVHSERTLVECLISATSTRFHIQRVTPRVS